MTEVWFNQPIDCVGHFSYLDAGSYSNVSPADTTACPVYGMFEAAREYIPRWGFETNVAEEYGKLVVKPHGECSYLFDTLWAYDFQVPCKAHDYCYDLRRAGFSGTVSDSHCDDWFYFFMEAHCEDRSILLRADCRNFRDIAYAAVQLVTAGPNPGIVEVRNRATNKCAEVTNGSAANGALLQQWSCSSLTHQRFRIWPAPGEPGYFHIKPVHSGKCARTWGSNSTVFQDSCIDTYKSEQMFIQGALNQNQYSIRDVNSYGWNCWAIPSASTNGVDLTFPFCNDYINWHIWRIVSG